jgi:hypothetical protein
VSFTRLLQHYYIIQLLHSYSAITDQPPHRGNVGGDYSSRGQIQVSCGIVSIDLLSVTHTGEVWNTPYSESGKCVGYICLSAAHPGT